MLSQWCPTLCDPMNCSPSGSSVRGDSPGKNAGVSVRNPGIELRSPALQVDSLPSESPRKLKHSGMGSLSIPQGIFLTQKLSQGLLVLQADSFFFFLQADS